MTVFWKRPGWIADQIFHAMQKNLTQVVDNFVDSKFPDLRKQLMAWRPHMDLKETDKEYILTADIPGVEKKHLKVELDQGILTIKGERTIEAHNKDETHHYTERCHGEFTRSFIVDEDAIELQKMNAQFENGVLTVTLKKKHGHDGKSKGSAKKIEIQ